MAAFDILMVIAVGSLTGTGLALIISTAAEIRGKDTSMKSRNVRILNFALITGCSCICIIGLGWIFLT
jgi:hypothetical protein